MSVPTAASLQPPPAELFDERGALRVGTYIGSPGTVDFSRAISREGPAFALTRHKRWMYVAVATEDLYIGAAVVDLRYAANAFAFAVETGPSGGKMLADTSFLGVPGIGCRVGNKPESGCDVWFRAPGAKLSLERGEGASRYELQIVTSKLTVHASLEVPKAPGLCAITRPANSPGMFTEKRALLGVRGAATIGGLRRSLDGALAGFDYTQGFPPRETAWKWAYLLGKTESGRGVGLNLVEGWNGQPECAVWIDDEVHPVGEGVFVFDHARPLLPWHISTSCGAVDLTFKPAAAHQERRNLLVVQSFFVQPAGVFAGTLRLPGRPEERIIAAPGVVEDQFVRWLSSAHLSSLCLVFALLRRGAPLLRRGGRRLRIAKRWRGHARRGGA